MRRWTGKRFVFAGSLLLIVCDPILAGSLSPIARTQVERGSSHTESPSERTRQTVQRIAGGFEYRSQDGTRDEGRRINFEGVIGAAGFGDLGEMDNSEYSLRGTVAGPVVTDVDATIDAQSTRRFASLNESFSGNAREEEHRASANLTWQALPRLQLKAAAEVRDADTPISVARNLGIKTTVLRPTARVRLTDRLYVGAGFGREDGQFRNATAPRSSDYEDTRTFGFAEVQFLEKGTGWLEIGEVKRQPDDGMRAFKKTFWVVGAQYPLTAKTSINAQSRREIENHFGRDVAAYVTETSWQAGINWQITPKTGVYYGYARGQREFLQAVTALPLNVIGPLLQPVEGRKDNFSTQTLKVRYQGLSWLLAELYFQLDDLDSNRDSYAYDGNMIGLTLEARKFESQTHNR